jgi:hypothetical protein
MQFVARICWASGSEGISSVTAPNFRAVQGRGTRGWKAPIFRLLGGAIPLFVGKISLVARSHFDYAYFSRSIVAKSSTTHLCLPGQL